MTNLAKALQKYYKREGSRVIFNNGQSLNQLALNMWELLDYQQIDASVISRVLKGERLFTSPQLKTFCKILDLSKTEEDYLFSCLTIDVTAKKNILSDTFLVNSSIGYEVIKHLLDSSFKMLYEGNTKELEKKSNLTATFIDTLQNSDKKSGKQELDELIALNLYLKGRVIDWLGLPQRVIKEVPVISNKLLQIAALHKNKAIYGYAHVLLANAYYLAAGYSYSKNKFTFYLNAIKHGRIAIENLPDDDNEKLIALRTIAVSAIHLKDQETLMYVFKKAKEILYLQPHQNRLNALLLCATLGKGLALFHISDPFSLKESAILYFKNDLTNAGVYEASDIKEDIDALIFLETQDKAHILGKIQKGIAIADKHNFVRHKQFFINRLKDLHR